MKGRRILVTGVGKRTGLGYEVVRQAQAEGAEVWVSARSVQVAEDMATSLGASGALTIDIADLDSVAAAARTMASGGLDVLINNAAAMSPWGEVAARPDFDGARAVFDTTLWGTWAMCVAFLPLLRKSRAGRLVNVSSGAGSHGDAAFGLTAGNAMGTSYAISKAALNALTAKLAQEEQSEVRINAVCPGFTATFDGGETMGARPVADGAASILWAARLPDDGPTGGFFRDGTPLPW
ncbi:MAG: SDR family NAD(P)-dependent oxidoreductase [Pseudomonadota bacterium]